MTREELIQFLKENLRVRINETWGPYEERPRLTVELYLGDECISSDYEYRR